MSIRIPADYLTLHEVRERWKLPADSLDVHRAILKGILRPSVFVMADLVVAHSPLQTYSDAGERHSVRGFCYVQGLQQTGTFDCAVPAVSYAADPQSGGALYLVDRPLTMDDLFAQAVVMLEDVVAAENMLMPEDLTTKEYNSVLKLITIAAADGYGYSPNARSSVPSELCEAGTKLGIDISENTVRKILRQAFEQFAPQVVA
ncbi:MAG: hypothetical protein DI587_22250 [Variovorax paradoxus]|nr:MAG: hypothetical protein DI583_22250 [Variovorax paradoxus]PZQ06395.1 MAG: hypothetical protein DI587_22250 [Variovorax paradoxus]